MFMYFKCLHINAVPKDTILYISGYFCSFEDKFISVGFSSMCSFEQSNVCAWTQDRTDAFDWTVNKGKTQSSETGPPSDHSLGTGILLSVVYKRNKWFLSTAKVGL